MPNQCRTNAATPDPFSAYDVPQAQAAPATPAGPQLFSNSPSPFLYSVPAPNPYEDLEDAVEAFETTLPSARASEAQPSKRTPLKPTNKQERAKLAVLANLTLFGGFLTINLGPTEDPDDALRRWRDRVHTLCGIRPDHYSVFVNYRNVDGRHNPHIHSLVICEPGDAVFEACARYAYYFDKRRVVAGGPPIHFEQVDETKGGVIGLLSYMHSRRNVSDARLKTKAASIHRSGYIAGVGRALTAEQITDARQRLADYEAARRAKAQNDNSPAHLAV